jgi:hypothetical protein
MYDAFLCQINDDIIMINPKAVIKKRDMLARDVKLLCGYFYNFVGIDGCFDGN